MTVCTVTCNIKDIMNADVNYRHPVFVQLNKGVDYNSSYVVCNEVKKIIPKDGTFSVDLLDNINMSVDNDTNIYYIFYICGNVYRKIVPDTDAADFTTLDSPTEINE